MKCRMKGWDLFMPQKIKQTQDISLGENLRKLRNSAGLTQEQVIAQLQIRNFSTSRSAYSQMESGTYNIRVSELIALAEIFHTDYNTIFKDLTYNK
ncbi:Helix-turn-helix domain protein [Clostridiales bacterium CHKCI001]|nr:Helix-turn-helix domain protein [Clostridiales bacterium CHKCI001]